MVNKTTILFARFVIAFCILEGCQQKAPRVPSYDKKLMDTVVNKNDTGTANKSDTGTVNNEPKKLGHVDVISLKEDYEHELLQLYNESGDVWRSFKVTDTFADNNIEPFAQKVENNVLVFRCVGIKGEFYKVVVNEEEKITKYLKGSSPYFNYETWPERLLHVFSVDFDYKKNPLRTQPSSKASVIKFDPDQFYHPIEVKGDWLKVKDHDDNKVGWIKWRCKDGDLMIQINYDA
jgi:hypothetical protein